MNFFDVRWTTFRMDPPAPQKPSGIQMCASSAVLVAGTLWATGEKTQGGGQNTSSPVHQTSGVARRDSEEKPVVIETSHLFMVQCRKHHWKEASPSPGAGYHPNSRISALSYTGLARITSYATCVKTLAAQFLPLRQLDLFGLLFCALWRGEGSR